MRGPGDWPHSFNQAPILAQSGFVDLPTAFARLGETNFRYSPALLDALLAQHEANKP